MFYQLYEQNSGISSGENVTFLDPLTLEVFTAKKNGCFVFENTAKKTESEGFEYILFYTHIDKFVFLTKTLHWKFGYSVGCESYKVGQTERGIPFFIKDVECDFLGAKIDFKIDYCDIQALNSDFWRFYYGKESTYKAFYCDSEIDEIFELNFKRFLDLKKQNF